MQPQSLNEEKLIPLDTSGENVDVELKEEQGIQIHFTALILEEVSNKQKED